MKVFGNGITIAVEEGGFVLYAGTVIVKHVRNIEMELDRNDKPVIKISFNSYQASSIEIEESVRLLRSIPLDIIII